MIETAGTALALVTFKSSLLPLADRRSRDGGRHHRSQLTNPAPILEEFLARKSRNFR
ncbi:MAG TPA: hypothetical protein VHI77_00800 [Solirubrobacterales bacterium]|nr:hypothetical protein [Solirubrobacterales bacterium]